MTLDEAIAAIKAAPDRSAATAIRNQIINAAMRGDRPQSDWDAVCAAVIERWGAAAIGGPYPDGYARTGD
jgi:hypothetical protein